MTNIKIAVVGNCQARPVAQLLERMYEDVEIVTVAIVHLLNDAQEKEYNLLFEEADFIVTQPIGTNFLCQFVSTDKMKKKYGEKILRIPNLFYKGYNPDLQYIRVPGKGALKGPFGDYHSKIIFDSWSQGDGIGQLENKIASFEYWEKEFIDVHELSLHTLAIREQCLEIQMVDDINNNLGSSRLFYTFNHPSLKLLNMLVDKIANKLCLIKKEEMVELPREPLNQFMAPISEFTMQQLSASFDNEEQGYKGLNEQVDGIFKGGKHYTSREMYEACYKFYSENAKLLVNLRFS